MDRTVLIGMCVYEFYVVLTVPHVWLQPHKPIMVHRPWIPCLFAQLPLLVVAGGCSRWFLLAVAALNVGSGWWLHLGVGDVVVYS